jgi:asparagine synthase (glutamine-hydrolysing)
VNVVDDWLRDAAANKMMETLLDSSSEIYQYLKPNAVRDLITQHTSGRSDNHKVLFSLVVLEQWLRVHAEPVAAIA